MSYWLREIAGWALVAIGLGVLSLAILFLANGLVWQTTPIAVIGIFVFRGGIHLLKVAMAARICEQAARALREPQPLEPRPARALKRL
jgi:amino acid permease